MSAAPASIAAARELARSGSAVLDVRDEISFAAGHVPGSGNIPRSELAARRAELPPRGAGVLVVAASGAEAAAAAAELEGAGCVRVNWLDAPWVALAPAPDRGPAAILWRPAPFLEEVLPLLPRGRALDLAAGMGRDAVFLAMHGFQVEAWDIDPEALARAARLARRHCVTLHTRACDLEAPDPPIPCGRFQLVTCFRFLHRPLFPLMTRALAPGGCLVYETYRRGQERFGRPKRPRFLLEPGELARGFESLERVRYEEPDPPGGPLTARLLARRPA